MARRRPEAKIEWKEGVFCSSHIPSLTITQSWCFGDPPDWSLLDPHFLRFWPKKHLFNCLEFESEIIVNLTNNDVSVFTLHQSIIPFHSNSPLLAGEGFAQFCSWSWKFSTPSFPKPCLHINKFDNISVRNRWQQHCLFRPKHRNSINEYVPSRYDCSTCN